ncbi:uncharacterized protein RHOBADRAFT_55220, partial [Rhodotorula graminis WP1]
ALLPRPPRPVRPPRLGPRRRRKEDGQGPHHQREAGRRHPGRRRQAQARPLQVPERADQAVPVLRRQRQPHLAHQGQDDARLDPEPLERQGPLAPPPVRLKEQVPLVGLGLGQDAELGGRHVRLRLGLGRTEDDAREDQAVVALCPRVQADGRHLVQLVRQHGSPRRPGRLDQDPREEDCRPEGRVRPSLARRLGRPRAGHGAPRAAPRPRQARHQDGRRRHVLHHPDRPLARPHGGPRRQAGQARRHQEHGPRRLEEGQQGAAVEGDSRQLGAPRPRRPPLPPFPSSRSSSLASSPPPRRLTTRHVPNRYSCASRTSLSSLVPPSRSHPSFALSASPFPFPLSSSHFLSGFGETRVGRWSSRLSLAAPSTLVACSARACECHPRRPF